MALKDFMPYGASELLADQDRRMARASASATALLVTVFAALMMWMPRVPIAANGPAEFPGYVLEPKPESPDSPIEPLVPATPIAPAAPDRAVPIPVPDVIAPDPATSQPATTGGPETGEPGGSSTPSGDPGGGTDPGTVDPVPGIGDFVIVDEYPALVSSPEVVYPDIAREAGVEGRVVVRMLVGRDGRVKDAVVDARHSVPMLDPAALAAARASVFTPALTNGHAVAVWVARPYEFRLH